MIGMKVHAICETKTIIVALSAILKIKNVPIITSKLAKVSNATLPLKIPNVINSIVFIAISCAGLAFGKNFSPPNQMNIIPMLNRRRFSLLKMLN